MKNILVVLIMLFTCRSALLRRSCSVVAATSTTTSSTIASSLSSPSIARQSSSSTAAPTGVGNSMKEQQQYSTSTTPPTKLVQLQIVHRHGDRTPITPLQDASFWEDQLIPQSTLERIAQHTSIVRDPNHTPNNHGAIGRGPFGQLTKLGLLQMIRVGTTIREQYSSEAEDPNVIWNSISRPLHPSTIQIYSTDFARTIQSVQGLLVGLFPNESSFSSSEPSKTITIDVRHTSLLIPDPQPRQTHEQVELEQQLARDGVVRQREQDKLPLALRTSQLLQPFLGPAAHEVSFGVDQEHPGDEEIEIQPLAWNQLAEICKCLSVYDQLPKGIHDEDVEEILHYAAQRWFHNLQHPRLCYLAMNALVQKQLEQFVGENGNSSQPPVTIWSAHDSTLIGLLCAYHLKQPTTWPDYASYLILEKRIDEQGQAYVRFAMNGQYLRCSWNENEEPVDMIPLDLLLHQVKTTTGEETVMTSSIKQ